MVAHNIAWKLALVTKGLSKDPEMLLNSYSAEVGPIGTKLTQANSNYSEDNWDDSQTG